MSGRGNSAPGGHDDAAARIERRWAFVSAVLLTALVAIAAYAGVHLATMPQARLETVDPRTLSLAGEFIESNLGTALDADGGVTVRAVGQQYSFTPQCILVPTGTPVTFRATSADVVHGFLIDGTNVNTMLVPGYVSVIATRFDRTGEHTMPCHEYCGVGHEGMWGRIRVIDRQDFLHMAADRRRLDCVK
jgi:cytochrome c oxidase subunit 2